MLSFGDGGRGTLVVVVRGWCGMRGLELLGTDVKRHGDRAEMPIGFSLSVHATVGWEPGEVYRYC